MANLVITPANVQWIRGVRPRVVRGGGTITRGQVIRQDHLLRYALADASNPAAANAEGIAVTDGTADSEMMIARPGSIIDLGVTTVAGTAYVLSATPGAICPLADLTEGDTPVFLFWGTGSSVVTVDAVVSPAQVPGGD